MAPKWFDHWTTRAGVVSIDGSVNYWVMYLPRSPSRPVCVMAPRYSSIHTHTETYTDSYTRINTQTDRHQLRTDRAWHGLDACGGGKKNILTLPKQVAFWFASQKDFQTACERNVPAGRSLRTSKECKNENALEHTLYQTKCQSFSARSRSSKGKR